jgi:hypothetical protein
MPISSISPGTSLLTTGASTAGFRQRDLQALGQALNSGDLAAAKTALTTFQQNLQNQASSVLNNLNSNSPASRDIQSIQTALKTGDLPGAKSAFSQLRSDLRSAPSAHHGRHHTQAQPASDPNAIAGATSTNPASSSSNSTDAAAENPAAQQLMQILGRLINQQA